MNDISWYTKWVEKIEDKDLIMLGLFFINVIHSRPISIGSIYPKHNAQSIMPKAIGKTVYSIYACVNVLAID